MGKTKSAPFTFTSLPKQNNLEFVIKIYPTHARVTEALSTFKHADELILSAVFGATPYRGKHVF